MKKNILAFILLIIVFQPLTAQEQNYPLSFGPFLSMKGGMNSKLEPAGRRNGPAFNGLPDFGLSFYIPVHQEKTLGLMLDLAYSTYAYQLKSTVNTEKFTMKYSYLTFAPNFHFSGLMIGFNFGLPISADYSGATISTTKIGFMAEFRVSGEIPLIEDDLGRLNLYTYAGYMLTGIYKNVAQDDPMQSHFPIPNMQNFKYTNEYNPRVLSLAIGVSYLFNIQQTSSESPE